MPLVGGFGYLELCLYGIREMMMISNNQSTIKIKVLHSGDDIIEVKALSVSVQVSLSDKFIRFLLGQNVTKSSQNLR